MGFFSIPAFGYCGTAVRFFDTEGDFLCLVVVFWGIVLPTRSYIVGCDALGDGAVGCDVLGGGAAPKQIGAK